MTKINGESYKNDNSFRKEECLINKLYVQKSRETFKTQRIHKRIRFQRAVRILSCLLNFLMFEQKPNLPLWKVKEFLLLPSLVRLCFFVIAE